MLSTKTGKLILNGLILVSAVAFLIMIDAAAKHRRNPSRTGKAGEPARIIRVNSQRDAYDVYHNAGLWGARVIHLNRFFNLIDYFPKEEALSAPFPLQVYDIRPAYEKGLDSHNWLFIATRTGMVRAVASVLPDVDFKRVSGEFLSDFAFTFSKGNFSGFTYDIPWTISTVDTLPFTKEPVVVNIDAGFFMGGADPVITAEALRNRCRNVSMIIVIASYDEADITTEARNDLGLFEAAWRGI